MKFRYTILYVDDVEASLGFYHRAFGCEIGLLVDSKDYGELVTGETKLAFCARSLLQDSGKSPAHADPAGPTFELGFETGDVNAAYAKAIAAGAKPVQPPRQEPWGQVTSYVSDPSGFWVEICSPVASPA